MATELEHALEAELPGVDISEVRPGTYRVTLPSRRHLHDSIALALVATAEGGWEVSDAGSTGFLLGDDLSEVTDLLACSGAPFRLADDNSLVASLDGASGLPALISDMAHYVESATVVWHVLECQTRAVAESKAPPATEMMARESADEIRRRIPVGKELIQLNRRVGARGESAKAPLVVAAHASRPRLVASFLDSSQPGNVVALQKRMATWLFTVLEDLHIPKFVVVRADSEEVGHTAEFYDRRNVVTVASDDRGRFVEEAVGTVRQLVG